MAKYWIKLYMDSLDDPKIARLPDHLWRRMQELSLMAGKQGDDGGLPPVRDIAWKLHLPEEKILEDLHTLEEDGLVYEPEPGVWFVTDFKEQQTSESYERFKRYKQRSIHVDSHVDSNVDSHAEYNEAGNVDSNAEYNETGNVDSKAEVAAGSSNSNSNSDSISDSNSDSSEEERIQGEGEPLALPASPTSPTLPASPTSPTSPTLPASPTLPTSPAEAMLHPDVRIFAEATGGRIPGLAQYKLVIESIRFLRAREKLDDKALVSYLVPYWLGWSSRKRVDGRPYDPGNITWLTEWALNNSLPESTRPAAPSVEETRKMLDEKDKKIKAAVPPPEEVKAKMRGLGGKLAGKGTHSADIRAP